MLVPVERLEPAVVLDVVRAVLQAAVALRHIGDQQVLDQTLRVPITSRKARTYLSKSLGNFILPLRIF